jgi:fructosamine-3-kinase
LQNRFVPMKFTDDLLRIPLKQFISEHTGRKWIIKEARDMAEFASHPAAILSDGAFSVFAKFSQAANGIEQFEIELAGLRLLSERSGVLIPTPMGIIPVPGGSILALETVQVVERTARAWRQIGQALRRIR